MKGQFTNLFKSGIKKCCMIYKAWIIDGRSSSCLEYNVSYSYLKETRIFEIFFENICKNTIKVPFLINYFKLNPQNPGSVYELLCLNYKWKFKQKFNNKRSCCWKIPSFVFDKFFHIIVWKMEILFVQYPHNF